MVGGRDYNAPPFNLATQGQRQPGSAFKPFILAAALKRGHRPGLGVAVAQAGSSTCRSGRQEKFVVNNFEDDYAGATTLAGATDAAPTTRSTPTSASRSAREGRARWPSAMGIRTPVSRNYAMTLGGLEQGVTPLDMAHAYETIAERRRARRAARSGARDAGRSASARSAGSTATDQAIAENKERRTRVLPKDVARPDEQQILHDRRHAAARRRAARHRRLRRRGKTGTTENYGDAWFVGFTERYTVAVWVGYPDSSSRWRPSTAASRSRAARSRREIWRDFMRRRRRDRPGARSRASAQGGQAAGTRRPRQLAARARRPARAEAPVDPATADPAAAGGEHDPRRRPTRRPSRARAEPAPAPEPTPAPPAPAPHAAPEPTADPGGGTRPARAPRRAAQAASARPGPRHVRLPRAQKRHGSSTAFVMPMRGARRRRDVAPGLAARPIRIGPVDEVACR